MENLLSRIRQVDLPLSDRLTDALSLLQHNDPAFIFPTKHQFILDFALERISKHGEHAWWTVVAEALRTQPAVMVSKPATKKLVFKASIVALLVNALKKGTHSAGSVLEHLSPKQVLIQPGTVFEMLRTDLATVKPFAIRYFRAETSRRFLAKHLDVFFSLVPDADLIEALLIAEDYAEDYKTLLLGVQNGEQEHLPPQRAIFIAPPSLLDEAFVLYFVRAVARLLGNDRLIVSTLFEWAYSRHKTVDLLRWLVSVNGYQQRNDDLFRKQTLYFSELIDECLKTKRTDLLAELLKIAYYLCAEKMAEILSLKETDDQLAGQMIEMAIKARQLDRLIDALAGNEHAICLLRESVKLHCTPTLRLQALQHVIANWNSSSPQMVSALVYCFKDTHSSPMNSYHVIKDVEERLHAEGHFDALCDLLQTNIPKDYHYRHVSLEARQQNLRLDLCVAHLFGADLCDGAIDRVIREERVDLIQQYAHLLVRTANTKQAKLLAAILVANDVYHADLRSPIIKQMLCQHKTNPSFVVTRKEAKQICKKLTARYPDITPSERDFLVRWIPKTGICKLDWKDTVKAMDRELWEALSPHVSLDEARAYFGTHPSLVEYWAVLLDRGKFDDLLTDKIDYSMLDIETLGRLASRFNRPLLRSALESRPDCECLFVEFIGPAERHFELVNRKAASATLDALARALARKSETVQFSPLLGNVYEELVARMLPLMSAPQETIDYFASAAYRQLARNRLPVWTAACTLPVWNDRLLSLCFEDLQTHDASSLLIARTLVEKRWPVLSKHLHLLASFLSTNASSAENTPEEAWNALLHALARRKRHKALVPIAVNLFIRSLVSGTPVDCGPLLNILHHCPSLKGRKRRRLDGGGTREYAHVDRTLRVLLASQDDGGNYRGRMMALIETYKRHSSTAVSLQQTKK